MSSNYSWIIVLSPIFCSVCFHNFCSHYSRRSSTWFPEWSAFLIFKRLLLKNCSCKQLIEHGCIIDKFKEMYFLLSFRLDLGEVKKEKEMKQVSFISFKICDMKKISLQVEETKRSELDVWQMLDFLFQVVSSEVGWERWGSPAAQLAFSPDRRIAPQEGTAVSDQKAPLPFPYLNLSVPSLPVAWRPRLCNACNLSGQCFQLTSEWRTVSFVSIWCKNAEVFLFCRKTSARYNKNMANSRRRGG